MPTRTFDPWQQEAIRLSGGRHLVLAPPGCGKTDILTERIVHAHEQGIAYSDMLCLTFTNRAAKGMAQRIANRTANPVPPDLFVGNVHRFCSQLLFSTGIAGLGSAIIDETDVDNIVKEELCARLGYSLRTSVVIRTQHGLWQMAHGVSPDLILHPELFGTDSLHKLCQYLGRPTSHESLAQIYSGIDDLISHYSALQSFYNAKTFHAAHAYEKYKADNDLLDYDDLLLLSYQWLTEHPSEAPHYSWIEIDEVQDLNPLQFAIVDLLATPDATIVYLGDEQQAIFSFIGAKMATIQSLKTNHEANTHHLHTNYRSPGYLLDLQNDFAQRCLGMSPDSLPSTDKHPPHRPEDLCLLDVVDSSSEGYYAARFALRYSQLDPNSRVALLVSTNLEAEQLSNALTAQGITHFKISGTDLFSQPSVRLLLAHAEVLTDEAVFIAWARLFWGLGISHTYTEARNLMRTMRREALLPTDILNTPGTSYVQQFVRAYDTEELVIFDTETTGLDPRTDDIIQIAAITVRGGQIVGRPFNIIIESDRELPPIVGGHPNPMLEVYRTSRRYQRAEGLRLFMRYCAGKTLVGHNATYDYSILHHNLCRSCPELRLADLCPRYFDTLKYIRLLRPRLRRYKLGYLVETLHLEGQNSHQADDDILATLSLLRYCHIAALPFVASQQRFLANNQTLFNRFRTLYAEVYHHGLRALDAEPTAPCALTAELSYAHEAFASAGLCEPIGKWPHVVRYIEQELVNTDLYPTLRQQLEAYTTLLCTTKEADLCGDTLQERFVVSTVHKAKGLEFETVIVFHAADGSYPNAHSTTEQDVAEDARRLFVAISRSRHRLCLTYASHDAPISPFLEHVQSHFAHFAVQPGGRVRLVGG